MTVDQISYVALPELLLALNGYRNNSIKTLFYESSTSESSKAGLLTRLSIVLNFLRTFPTA